MPIRFSNYRMSLIHCVDNNSSRTGMFSTTGRNERRMTNQIKHQLYNRKRIKLGKDTPGVERSNQTETNHAV